MGMLWVFGRKVNEAILLCAGMVLPGGDGRRGCSDGVKPVRNSSIGAIPELPENGGSNRPYRPSSVICFANATFPQGGRLFRMRIGSCLFVGEGVPYGAIRTGSGYQSTIFTLHSSLFTLHSSLFALHSSLFTLRFPLSTTPNSAGFPRISRRERNAKSRWTRQNLRSQNRHHGHPLHIQE